MSHSPRGGGGGGGSRRTRSRSRPRSAAAATTTAPPAASGGGGWLSGLVNSTVDSFTAEKVGEQYAVKPQAHVSVVGSTSPQTDAQTMAWLFPHKFRIEPSPESVLLMDRATFPAEGAGTQTMEETSSDSVGLTIMLVNTTTTSTGLPLWKNVTMMCDESEIGHAIQRSKQRPSCTIFYHQRLDVTPSMTTTLAVLRLSGGSNVILLTHALLKSHLGRSALVEYIQSREKIESKEYLHRLGSSGLLAAAAATTTTAGDDWLDDLEGEFATRPKQQQQQASSSSQQQQAQRGGAPPHHRRRSSGGGGGGGGALNTSGHESSSNKSHRRRPSSGAATGGTVTGSSSSHSTSSYSNRYGVGGDEGGRRRSSTGGGGGGGGPSRRRSSTATSLNAAGINDGSGGNSKVLPTPEVPFPNLSLSLQRKHGFWQRNVPINSRESLPFETDLFSGKMVLLLKPLPNTTTTTTTTTDQKRTDQTMTISNMLREHNHAVFMLQIQGQFKYVPQGTVYAGMELDFFGGDGNQHPSAFTTTQHNTTTSITGASKTSGGGGSGGGGGASFHRSSEDMRMKPPLLMRALIGRLLKSIQTKHPNAKYSLGGGSSLSTTQSSSTSASASTSGDHPGLSGTVGQSKSTLLLGPVSGTHHGANSRERPHLVIPAWTFFDRIVATKAHLHPPSIEEPLFEPMGSVRARWQSGSRGAWNTKDTYSFCTMSPYLDLGEWKLLLKNGIDPAMTMSSSSTDGVVSVDLSQLWGAAATLRLVLFEQRVSGTNYLFALQMHHIGPSSHTDDDDDGDEDDDDDEDIDLMDDAIERKANKPVVVDEEYAMSYLLKKEKDMARKLASKARNQQDDDLFIPLPQTSHLPTKKLLDTARICPAWFEVVQVSTEAAGGQVENEKQRRLYRKYFAFCPKGASRLLLRSVKELQKHVDFDSAVTLVDGMANTARLSEEERVRRILGYAVGSSQSSSKLLQFSSWTKTTDFDRHFLKSSSDEPSLMGDDVPMKRGSKVGSCARMISEHHWKEESMLLVGHLISFFHPDHADTPNLAVNLQSVVSFRSLEKNEASRMPGFHFLEMEMLGRIVRLMFGSSTERDDWMAAMEAAIPSEGENTTTASNDEKLEATMDPMSHFFHESTMWNCKERRVLNCRRVAFPKGASKAVDALPLLESCMLLGYEVQETQSAEVLLEFLDSVSTLKLVDLYALESEKERLTFFLNLYHLMIIHANLLLGALPPSAMDFAKRMHMVSYQVSDDIFSLAELEHNILRGKAMDGWFPPTQYHPGYPIPTSTYNFALKELVDFRVLFALNVGSMRLLRPPKKSIATSRAKHQQQLQQQEQQRRRAIPTIPIYNSEILDTQLEATALMFLEEVKVELRSESQPQLIVTLPKVCQWFLVPDCGNNVWTMLKKISPLMSEQNRIFLNGFEDQILESLAEHSAADAAAAGGNINNDGQHRQSNASTMYQGSSTANNSNYAALLEERIGVRYLSFPYKFHQLRIEDSRVRKRLSRLDVDTMTRIDRRGVKAFM